MVFAGSVAPAHKHNTTLSSHRVRVCVCRGHLFCKVMHVAHAQARACFGVHRGAPKCKLYHVPYISQVSSMRLYRGLLDTVNTNMRALHRVHANTIRIPSPLRTNEIVVHPFCRRPREHTSACASMHTMQIESVYTMGFGIIHK